jgi:salicylate hydroxylase
LDEQQPGLRVIDPTKPGALEIHLSMDGSTRSVIMYPCREYELLNVGCITPDAVLQTATTESWSAEGSKEDLLRCFSDFSPSVLKVLDSAEYIKVWQLRDQDPLPSYRRGRVVLVGDAAHSMTPHQGQGCNQAIEDAEGFRLFNQPGVSRDSISDLLTDFDRVRRPRASKIQNYTRQAHHKASAQDLWKYTDYNYTYPGILECLRRLNLGKEMIRARQYPDGLHAKLVNRERMDCMEYMYIETDWFSEDLRQATRPLFTKYFLLRALRIGCPSNIVHASRPPRLREVTNKVVT